jgi:heat-inducible transcriptional repressor
VLKEVRALVDNDKSNTARANLTERAQLLLKTLVERYIIDGQPVGSRTLSRDSSLELSPATIRNVMADLEELGFLRAPHTSAGRVPTDQGFRFFVDSLLQVKPLESAEVDSLRRRLDPDQGTNQLIQTVSSMLSGFTHLASVVTLPRRDSLILRQVEFLSLSGNRVLVILVANEHDVQNRIIHTQRTYSPAELQQAANYLNEQFAGKDIYRVRETILGEMQETREDLNLMMQTVVEMAEKAFGERGEDDFVLAGETHLMDFAELSNVEKLRLLFDAFNRKRDILHLLDQCLNADGIQIFIGQEVGFEVLDQCSVITAPYSIDDTVMGVLGVIGPTRMPYERVIPIVDVTARLLASALNSRD